MKCLSLVMLVLEVMDTNLAKHIVLLLLVTGFSLKELSMYVWNNLPQDIVDFTSITSFQRTIKLLNLSAHLKVLSSNTVFIF